MTVNVDVSIKRAPTDESVRLLREMEESARHSVDSAISVGGNGFECVVHVERDYLSDIMCYRCLFALNGRKMDARVDWRQYREDPKGAIQELIRVVADRIAREILSGALAAL